MAKKKEIKPEIEKPEVSTYDYDLEKLDAFLLVQRDLGLLKESAQREQGKSDFYSDLHNNILSRALEYLRELDPRPPIKFANDSDIPF